MDAYMATLFGGDLGLGLVLQVGTSKKLDQLSIQVPHIYLHKMIKIQL